MKKNETDPYSSVQSQCEGKTDITALDPIDLSPCSSESVSKVMNHIQKGSKKETGILYDVMVSHIYYVQD